MALYPPSEQNDLVGAGVFTRKSSPLERFLGPDAYRVLQGLFKTAASITGLVLLLVYMIIALAAPVLAPPLAENDPYMIPRDGFKTQPRPPGTEWRVKPPPLPFWWQRGMGTSPGHVSGTI